MYIQVQEAPFFTYHGELTLSTPLLLAVAPNRRLVAGARDQACRPSRGLEVVVSRSVAGGEPVDPKGALQTAPPSTRSGSGLER